MSTKTTNYELVKPELSDAADITAMNSNWDKIDTMLKNLTNEGWLTPVTTENQDLDNYVTQGIYSFDSAYAPINRPDNNSNGWLIVIPWNNNPGVGTVKQLWLRHGTLNSNDHCLYVRTRIGSNNAWSTWAQIYTNKDIDTVIAGYLPLSGGVMTGNIQHKRGDVTSTPIRVSESGNDYGSFLQIGAGGDVIIGSGESFTGIATAESIDGSQKNMYVGSDGEIRFFTNCNSIGSRKKIVMDANGRITVPDTADPSTAYNLTTKKYVDNSLNTAKTDLESQLESQGNSKQDNITGAASTITDKNLTANRAIISNSSGKLVVSPVTTTELGYLSGVTSKVQTQLNGKQNTLTFDNAPTSGSSNPVKSGGVFSALNEKQDALTFDNTPTENSANPVKSGGVFSALSTLGAQIDGKAKIQTGSYVGTGTHGSSNPNSLHFSFVPKVVIVATEGNDIYQLIMVNPISSVTNNWAHGDWNDTHVNVLWDTAQNSVSWYSDSSSVNGALFQLNDSNKTYCFAAIG